MKIRAYISRFRDRVRFFLTIILAPLTISLIADIIIQNIKGIELPAWQYISTAILIAIFVFLLVAGYTDKFDKIVVEINHRKRFRSLRNPKVLILDGKIGSGEYEVPPEPVFTNFTPQDWEGSLRQATNWRVKIGSLSTLKEYQIVINPFGEVYPEENASNFSSFNQICEYVFSGGIFVNVAGYPFFYYHDTKDPIFIHKKIRAGILRKEPQENAEVITMRPLFPSIFHQLRELSSSEVVNCSQSENDRILFGEIAGAGGNSQATMFRAYLPNTPGIIPILSNINQDRRLIISLQYGDGFFLLAGLDLTGDGNTGFHKVIAAIKGWINYEVRSKK